MSENQTVKKTARYVELREINAEGDDILVVGGGGREHAIVKKLRESKRVGRIFAAPGNAGMDVVETGIGATDIDRIVKYVENNPNIKLTVVAPDDPLSMGLVDKLTAKGYRAFGPTQAAAKLEWSKAYAKDVMRRYGVPTASYGTFTDIAEAKAYIKGKCPIVVKADGLALGKGVLICNTEAEAEAAIDEIMADKKFGAAGNEVVIEQFLTGYEVSLLTFVDGKNFALMPTSCDHKRALDGDKGLNTGGMGAYSPCPVFTDKQLKKTVKEIVTPTVNAMIQEGAPFKGVLYFGLMVNGDDIKVLEYNARFGDPETQSVLPLLDTDLYEIMNAVIDGTLDKVDIKWKKLKSINVVLASGGYPQSYKKGCEITGLETVDNDASVYYAGVKHGENGFVTSGGRVLCVQAMAKDFATARKTVYDNIAKIKFDDCFYRKDIGAKLK
ncbi:MAG: phosphoribosylamine--glycine ligase [Clostridiales bacterium]|nr:phosphoribosylamine--glycine ligase [Clostridiales bacterium]